MPWLGIVLVGSCPSGELSCHGWELSWWEVVLVGSCHAMVGNCPGGELS